METINLLYCANAKVFDGIMLSLLSATNKTKHPIHAYIMTMDLRDLNQEFRPIEQAHIDLLNTVLQIENSSNQVILVDATSAFKEKMRKSPNLNTRYTPYTLLRLLANEFDFPDRLLYVDADTMFNDDVSKILKYDITDFELAGVVDHLGKRFIAKDYLNAGVLYLNMPKIKETRLFDRALDLCLNKEMVFPDQDAINELVTSKLILPRKFNEQQKWRKDTIIQHFAKTIQFFPIFKVINIKQWHIERVQKSLKLHVYDVVFNKFKYYRSIYGKDFLEPLKEYPPIKWKEQLKINISEVKAYIKQNGGIFRKKKKIKTK